MKIIEGIELTKEVAGRKASDDEDDALPPPGGSDPELLKDFLKDDLKKFRAIHGKCTVDSTEGSVQAVNNQELASKSQ